MADAMLIHFAPLLNRLENSLHELHALLNEAKALTEGLLLGDLHEAVHLPDYISALRRVLVLADHTWDQSMVRFLTLQDDIEHAANSEKYSARPRD